MSILVCVTGRNNEKLMEKLRLALPGESIYEWPKCDRMDEIEFLIAWNVPEEVWPQLPNLKVVQSFGAGVDAIPLSLLPKHVVVTRVVDPNLAKDMAEYVLTHILAAKLRIKEYNNNQHARHWYPRRAKSQQVVGILGFGELGRVCASRLIENQFRVKAWSRSPKEEVQGIEQYFGEKQQNDFLAGLDYLVCLLPLTEKTENVLNHALFAKLKPGCYLINVARGKHLVEEDLLSALKEGVLSGATLDVFREEPLPDTHPFWANSKITITPHVAALTSLPFIIEQISMNFETQKEGKILTHIVDKSRGY